MTCASGHQPEEQGRGNPVPTIRMCLCSRNTFGRTDMSWRLKPAVEKTGRAFFNGRLLVEIGQKRSDMHPPQAGMLVLLSDPPQSLLQLIAGNAVA